MAERVREVTIVIVTHNMQQAQRTSGQCAFFLADKGEPGSIVESGPIDAMFEDPQDRAPPTTSPAVSANPSHSTPSMSRTARSCAAVSSLFTRPQVAETARAGGARLIDENARADTVHLDFRREDRGLSTCLARVPQAGRC